jgi:hypothetical protein
VGNLSFDATEADLRDLFRSVGATHAAVHPPTPPSRSLKFSHVCGCDRSHGLAVDRRALGLSGFLSRTLPRLRSAARFCTSAPCVWTGQGVCDPHQDTSETFKPFISQPRGGVHIVPPFVSLSLWPCARRCAWASRW